MGRESGQNNSMKNCKFGATHHLGVSKNRGTPKWMVKIMEKPIKMDELGVPLFLEPQSFRRCLKIFKLVKYWASTLFSCPNKNWFALHQRSEANGRRKSHGTSRGGLGGGGSGGKSNVSQASPGLRMVSKTT